MKGVKFVNRLGCRGGVYASNALALIQYHSHIVPVIEGAIIATKKKLERKSTATARKQLDKLANIMPTIDPDLVQERLYGKSNV